MSHQTIVIREEDTTLRIEQVVVPSRITSKITLPVGGAPFTFCDENGNLLLTLDEDGNIISEKGFFELSGQAAPALSPAGKMRLYFDSGLNKLLLSENGGAYADLMDGSGDVVGPAGATNDALVRWDTATGKLVQDSNALLNDAGDLTLVGNLLLGKFLNVEGIAAPALSPAGEARLYFDSGTNKLRLSENGGAFDDIVGAGGDVVGPAGATNDALVRWDTATGKLVQDSNALLNDAGDLMLVGSQSLGKFLDVAGIAAPAVSPGGESRLYFDSTSNKLRVSENGGAFVDVLGGGDLVDDLTPQLGGDLDLNGSSIIDAVGNMTIGDGSAGQTLTWDGATGNIVFTAAGSIAATTSTFFITTSGTNIVIRPAGGALVLGGDGGNQFDVSGSSTFTTRFGNTFNMLSTAVDGASAVGLRSKTTVLDSTSFTAGALHSEWTDLNDVQLMTLTPGGALFLLSDIEIDGDLNHDGSNIGFYGTAPAAQSAAYTRNATVVEDRTLLASASATTINNNNVLAALIADIQATGLLG